MTGEDSRLLIRRVLLITNPASRSGRRLEHKAIRAFQDLDIACDAVATEQPGHAADLATRYAGPGTSGGYDAVFSLGGDGTAVEIVGALSPNGPPVGVLPGGTGNLLVRALEIPLGLKRAITSLVTGHEARIDLGLLDSGRRFAIGAGVGIDASMIEATPPSWKRRVGVLAYVATGAVHALRRRRFHASVTVDGTVIECQASAVLVANFGVLLNGLVTLGDGIRYDDGVLNVCIFDPVTTLDAIRIARKLLQRDFRPDRAMRYLQAKSVTVATDPVLPGQADGELIGNSPFSIVVEPLAARLLVPHCQINRQ